MTTWYPNATKRLGPGSKVQTGKNTVQGVVCHSAVGFRGGLYSVLDTTTGPRATTAWHFSAYQDGSVEQHYPLEAVLHHGGSTYANGNLIGIEHEGGFNPHNEPLTPQQREASVALVRWIAQQGKWQPRREQPGRTLHEHNEVSNVATACPSNRIPWASYITVLPTLTPQQREVLEWIEREGITGATRSASLQAVDLPPKAKLSDYAPAVPVSPPAVEVPKPEPPPTPPPAPPEPAAPTFDRVAALGLADAIERDTDAIHSSVVQLLRDLERTKQDNAALRRLLEVK